MEKHIKSFVDWKKLNESVGAGIEKILSKKTSEVLLKKLDKGAVKELDELFELVAKNEKNFIKTAEGKILIKSATGTQLPVELFERGLTAVLENKLSVEEFIKLLPEKMADGTSFRAVIENNLSKKLSGQLAKTAALNYSSKVHDAFYAVERSLSQNSSTDPFRKMKIWNDKNIIDITNEYSMFHSHPDTFSKKDLKEIVDALNFTLKPAAQKAWKPIAGETNPPLNAIQELINRIKHEHDLPNF